MINIYFMKPMLKLTSLLVVISSLFLVSCVKDLYDPNASNSNPDSDIPADFDFSTTKTVNLTVNVDDEYNNQYFYKVEVYDQNPFASDTVVNLLGGGVAKGSQPFVSQIVIPQSLNTIYVRQTDPLKRESVKAVDVATVTASSICDFKMAVTPATKSLESLPTLRADAEYTDKATDYPLPASYETLGATSPDDLGGKSYYIPSGVTNSTVKFGWSSNSSLYVAGTVSFSSSDNIYMPSGCKLIILPGGKVTINATRSFEQSGVIVAVHSGGTLTINQLFSAGAGAKIVNDGTLNLNADFEVRSSSLLMNNGTLNGKQVTLTNNAKFINNLTVKLSTNMVLNSNTLLRNNGTFEAVNKILTENTTSVIENNNHLKTIYIRFNGGGKLINNCYVLCEDFYSEQGEIEGASGTLISCQDFYGNNSAITLNGNAIFAVEDNEMKNNTSNEISNGATFNWNVTVTGVPANSLFPLLAVWKVDNKSTATGVLKLAGTMQVAYDNGQSPKDAYYSSKSSGVTFVSKPTIAIPGDNCNNGGVTPDPGTGTPTNPAFPIKIEESTSYTFAMEDRWPALGDYDMNDLIFVISDIVKNSNSQNLVGSMSFKLTPLAAGATFKSNAALQFDDIASGGITLSSTNSIGAIESGQTKANILLFPSSNTLFEKSSPSIINTILSLPKLAANTYTYNINFTTPVSFDKININKLNFYMIVGDSNLSNRTEIHLAGFSPSSKVKSATNGYKDSNNMIWGIMLPIGNFKYPAESIKIEDAYPQFKSWATSGGANNKSWYLNASSESGKVYNK